MSHQINVYIVKNQENLETSLQKNNIRYFKNNDFLIVHPKKFLLQTLSAANVENVVYAETDYFGGFGEQSSKFINLKENKKQYFSTINQALKLIGVKKIDNLDEFDTIGLGY